MNGPGQPADQVGLSRLQRRPIQHVEADAELIMVALCLARFLVQPFRAAEGQVPAIARDQFLGLRPGGLDEVGMGDDRPANQRRIALDDFAIVVRGTLPPIAQQRRCQPGQGQGLVACRRRQVQANLQQGLQVARKRMRPHPFALDDPGIAETGLAPRGVLVDQRHAAAPPQQVNAGGDADNAGPQDHHVGHVCLSHPIMTSLYSKCACGDFPHLQGS
jgi:hypothetical protein